MMTTARQKATQTQRLRRQKRVRAKLRGTAERPRLAVFRSLRHINAQLIDDSAQRTMVSARDTELSSKGATPLQSAKAVGALLAEKAKQLHITAVIFDRRSYAYHGRVAALAEGVRGGGLHV